MQNKLGISEITIDKDFITVRGVKNNIEYEYTLTRDVPNPALSEKTEMYIEHLASINLLIETLCDSVSLEMFKDFTDLIGGYIEDRT